LGQSTGRDRRAEVAQADSWLFARWGLRLRPQTGHPDSRPCWRMRLAHTKTLTYYLQETTAVSTLPALGQNVRESIQARQALMRFLFEAFEQRAANT